MTLNCNHVLPSFIHCLLNIFYFFCTGHVQFVRNLAKADITTSTSKAMILHLTVTFARIVVICFSPSTS